MKPSVYRRLMQNTAVELFHSHAAYFSAAYPDDPWTALYRVARRRLYHRLRREHRRAVRGFLRATTAQLAFADLYHPERSTPSCPTHP